MQQLTTHRITRQQLATAHGLPLAEVPAYCTDCGQPHDVLAIACTDPDLLASYAAVTTPAITAAQATATHGIRRDARDGGAWMLLDATGQREVGPRQNEALTSTQVLALLAAAKTTAERCGGCDTTTQPLAPCDGLGQLCPTCRLECPCGYCAG